MAQQAMPEGLTGPNTPGEEPLQHCAGTIAAALTGLGVVGVARAAYHYAGKVLSLYLRDRLTWMRFLGLGLGDAVPDADTIWIFARR
jgi:subtilisin family serine protease